MFELDVILLYGDLYVILVTGGLLFCLFCFSFGWWWICVFGSCGVVLYCLLCFGFVILCLGNRLLHGILFAYCCLFADSLVFLFVLGYV